MKKFVFLATAASASLLFAPAALAGKAETVEAPTFVTTSGRADASTLVVQWVSARHQELLGEDQIKGAEKQLRGAQKDERKFASRADKSRRETEDMRAAYVSAVAGFGAAPTPQAVEAEIKTLKKVADDWKDSLEGHLKDAEKLKTTETEIQQATAMLRAGQQSVSNARDEMRRVEALSNEPTQNDYAADDRAWETAR
jgi:hypothetical protein